MTTQASKLAEPGGSQIVIVRALPGLGDFLCAVPAWRALRKAFPRSRIALVGLPEVKHLVRRFQHYLDEFIEFPGFPGIIEQPPCVRHLPAFLQQMHAREFAFALQMHGNGRTSNLFTALLGAERTAGFYCPPQFCPDEELFLPYPAHLPEVERHLALLRFLGVPAQDSRLEFPLMEKDEQAWHALRRQYGLVTGSYVCVHPGARDAVRRWAPEAFAHVADGLHRRGLRVVLTGTAAEASLTAAVQTSMKSEAVDLAGRTDLGTMAALLKEARLLICNDTGVSHLADAVNAPSVVIFLASDLQRWAPLDRDLHRAVAGVRPVYRPDEKNTRLPSEGDASHSGKTGLRCVSPQMVLDAAGALLVQQREAARAG